MKTAIMTDTNSGLTVEQGRKLGVHVLPMPVIIDDKCFFEGQDIDYEDLWKAFEENREVRTSMPSTGELMQEWDRLLEEGYDEILYIPMTSGLSGACWAASAASREYDGKVFVADNHRISCTLMDSVLDALYMSQQGKTAEGIKEILEHDAYESTIYITVNSVRYLVKSGRVTETAARITDILHLKPVLQIQGGKLDSYAKARGINNAAEKMIAAIQHDLDSRFADVPRERISIKTAGTLRTAAECENWRSRVQEAFPGFRVSYTPLSCSIACHVGIDAIGVTAAPVRYDIASMDI